MEPKRERSPRTTVHRFDVSSEVDSGTRSGVPTGSGQLPFQGRAAKSAMVRRFNIRFNLTGVAFEIDIFAR